VVRGSGAFSCDRLLTRPSHESLLRVIIGTLLLVFGLQWLRKAILRAGRYKAFRDEAALYWAELATA
jgi:hypothetical protein